MKLELRGITKRFPGVVANEGVDLLVQPGEILGLLGENGAGKSTLMNILYGLYAPDEGEILIDGKAVHFSGPGDAIAAGIGMVHQHFMLVPVFTVTENIMLGVEETRGPVGTLDRRAASARILEISERHGLEVDPDALVEDLPVGVRQRVEILKTLYRKSDVLILDEPTAVLTPQEAEELFAIMRSLVEGGTSIVFITHKLNEVLEVADRITVLRRGRMVGTTVPAETTREELATMMVGREVDLVVNKPPAKPGEPVLELRDLVVRDERGHPAVNGLNLTVHAGEIVAIAGVQGNGQTELVEAITGLRDVDQGEVRINGTDFENDPRAVYTAGVAHVPEDRLEDGLVGDFTVADNMVLTSYCRAPFSNGLAAERRRDRRVRHRAGRAVRRPHALDLQRGEQPVRRQPAEGHRRARVLAAARADRRVPADARPRRRIDRVHPPPHRREARRGHGGAHRLDRARRGPGAGDRIAVMFQGTIVDILNEEATMERLGLLMGGAHPEEGQPEEAARWPRPQLPRVRPMTDEPREPVPPSAAEAPDPAPVDTALPQGRRSGSRGRRASDAARAGPPGAGTVQRVHPRRVRHRPDRLRVLGHVGNGSGGRPRRLWSSVIDTYGALLRGSLGDPGRLFSALVSLDGEALLGALIPLSETLSQPRR